MSILIDVSSYVIISLRFFRRGRGRISALRIMEETNSKQTEEPGSDIEQYQSVFTAYYATLCDSIPVEEMLPHLVSNEVITMREMEDVLAEKTTFRQARALLNGPIWRAISGGYPQAFVTFLCVLHSIHSCESLCEEICTKLFISAKVMTSKSREL